MFQTPDTGRARPLPAVMPHCILTTLIALCFLALPSPAVAGETVSVASHSSIGKEYDRILALAGGDVLRVDPHLPPGEFDRTAAELVIISRALRLGGMNKPLTFIDVGNPTRQIIEVARGGVAMTGQPFAVSLMEKTMSMRDLFVSSPIIRVGEFEKLIYCIEGNETMLASRSVEDLNRNGLGIIGLGWDNDEWVLKEMGVHRYTKSATFMSMTRMIIAGRADWIPLEGRNTPGMVRHYAGKRFVPVPGIKFSLIESRHFMISRNHPDGQEISTALEKGLAILRKEGFIETILDATGFHPEETRGWKVLNEDAVAQEMDRKPRNS